MKKILSIFLCIVVVSAAAYIYYKNFEPDRRKYPRRGIDVSHHQGKIDWALVSTDDVGFAYIKASEGTEFKDSQFNSNWQATAKLGIAHGAYHFYSLCAGGKEQAANFIATVPKQPSILPPAVDLEFGGNCQDIPPQEKLFAELKIFLGALEKHYQVKPMLYATKEFYRQYLQDKKDFADYPLWIRSIIVVPPGKINWRLWQYHNRGRVKGINGSVDLNVWND